jgi:hypothetical protein
LTTCSSDEGSIWEDGAHLVNIVDSKSLNDMLLDTTAPLNSKLEYAYRAHLIICYDHRPWSNRQMPRQSDRFPLQSECCVERRIHKYHGIADRLQMWPHSQRILYSPRE